MSVESLAECRAFPNSQFIHCTVMRGNSRDTNICCSRVHTFLEVVDHVRFQSGSK